MYRIGKYNRVKDYSSILNLIEDWDRNTFNELEEKYSNDILVAYHGDKLVAVAGANCGKMIVKPFLYVSVDYRRRGIGTSLLRQLEEGILQHERTIHAQYEIDNSKKEVVEFLKKNGFEVWLSGIWMSRVGDRLKHNNIKVRNYKDDDFLTYHNIESTTTFHMRESCGKKYNYYYPPNDNNRKYFNDQSENIYVLEDNKKIIGVGDIEGNELTGICILAEHQGKGHGSKFLKYLINVILDKGHNEVILEVMDGNPAQKLYEMMDFKEFKVVNYMVKYYREDYRQQNILV